MTNDLHPDAGLKLSFDPSVNAPRDTTTESVALAQWYDANPAIQRLWGVRETETLRVIVSLEPTHDSDDVFPVWVANCQRWTRQLHKSTGKPVQLELVGEPPLDGIEFGADSTIIADLFWRDPTVIPPQSAN